jgi:hypothetical protein
MHRKSDSFAREKAAHMEQIRASIGRCLRDKYDTSQPLPKRLADLVRKIKQPASKSKSSKPFFARGDKTQELRLCSLDDVAEFARTYVGLAQKPQLT